MSDRELLEEDSFNTNSKQCTKSTAEVTNADLFSLLKTYRNDKLSGIENNLNDRAVNLAKKVKKADPSFRFKGNQVQIELNAEISGNINVVLSELGRKNVRKAVKLLEDSLAVLKKRNKLIQIADKSEGGWTTVDEYLSAEVASDSEDQNRIRAAENRGVKKIKTSKKDDKQRGKRRPAEAAGAITQTTHNDGSSIASRSYQIQPFRAAGACAPAPHNISKANDSCHNCGLFGH
jgi:hypothetical protein